jgi:hypothetical protein
MIKESRRILRNRHQNTFRKCSPVHGNRNFHGNFIFWVFLFLFFICTQIPSEVDAAILGVIYQWSWVEGLGVRKCPRNLRRTDKRITTNPEESSSEHFPKVPSGSPESELPWKFHFWVFFLFFSCTQISSEVDEAILGVIYQWVEFRV